MEEHVISFKNQEPRIDLIYTFNRKKRTQIFLNIPLLMDLLESEEKFKEYCSNQLAEEDKKDLIKISCCLFHLPTVAIPDWYNECNGKFWFNETKDKSQGQTLYEKAIGFKKRIESEIVNTSNINKDNLNFPEYPNFLNQTVIDSNESHTNHFISLKIKNLTDEKLKNVKIFNFDSKNQEQVEYSVLHSSMKYEDFLRKYQLLDNDKHTIIKTRIISKCDYKKYELKQINSNINCIVESIFGLKSSTPIKSQIYLSAFQFQQNIVDIDFKILITSNLELELEYLMPETEIIINFSILTKNK
jgi:hypothetical protein